jgi:hypothetical protein
MDGIAPGPALVGNYVLFLAVRQLIVYLGWLLAAGLAGAGACWCCGYGAQAVWARAEAARHRWLSTRREGRPPDAVRLEADRGILAIEKYLETNSVILPRPERVDEDEPG